MASDRPTNGIRKRADFQNRSLETRGQSSNVIFFTEKGTSMVTQIILFLKTYIFLNYKIIEIITTYKYKKIKNTNKMYSK